MAIPSLYFCEVCGHPLDKNGNTVIRQATVWMKGKSRVVHSIISEDFRYIHEVCLSPSKNPEPTLF